MDDQPFGIVIEPFDKDLKRHNILTALRMGLIDIVEAERLLGEVQCDSTSLDALPPLEVSSEEYFNGSYLLTSGDKSASWYNYDWTISGKKIAYDVLYNDGAHEQADFTFHLDAKHSPMWFDLVSENYVENRIIKVENDTIT
jgi:hypothetical protein